MLQLDDNDHFITLCRRLMAEIGCETFLQGVNRNHQRVVLKSHQDLFSPARATSFVIGRSSRLSFNFMALEKKEIALNLFFTFTSSASTSDCIHTINSCLLFVNYSEIFAERKLSRSFYISFVSLKLFFPGEWMKKKCELIWRFAIAWGISAKVMRRQS